MPKITQTDDVTLFYVNYDGTKGSTWGVGHTVNHPYEFLLVTEDRDEWISFQPVDDDPEQPAIVDGGR